MRSLFAKRCGRLVFIHAVPAPAASRPINPDFPFGVEGSMSLPHAEAFCRHRGLALPSVEQLRRIAEISGQRAYAAHNWPKGIFWSCEDAGSGRHAAVFLGNGGVAPFPDTEKHRVACVRV